MNIKEQKARNIQNIKKKILRQNTKTISKKKKGFLKVNIITFQVQKKDFTGLIGRELKDKEVKIKREMEQIFFKPINLSIDDMEKFDQKDMDKKSPIKTLRMIG